MVWLYSFCKSARFLFVVLFSLNVFAAQVAIDPHPIEFKKDKIVLSGKTIQVEMAQTDDERSHGLMFRQKMSDEEGMLFIFPNEQSLSFWMKNTFIDLSIGYFDQNRTLVDIQEMRAMNSVMTESLPSYPSQKPAMYALEMNKGWFLKNKIKIGSRFLFQTPPKTQSSGALKSRSKAKSR